MKLSACIICILSGSLFIISFIFGMIIINLNKTKCEFNINDNICNKTINIYNYTNANNTDINNILVNYNGIYNIIKNVDLLNKFDILDNYNDRINIYAPDLNICFIICESTNTCLGFIRYHNYCYLKNNSSIEEQTISNGMDLFYKKK